jgi:uncharacterized membrane-anchored protein YitT (DUF2179 family)
MFKIFSKNRQILNLVNRKNYFLRILFLFIACFIYAFTYNLFFVPNNIVVGGMSGLAIIIKDLTNLSTSTFIYISSLVLIIIYYYAFGKNKTLNAIIGTIIFTFMVSLTESLAHIINISFDSAALMIILASLLYGISGGIIYRLGFNTGGSDIIASLVVKYAKISVGKATRIINSIIILLGALIFGLTNAVYAVIILILSSKIVDIVMLGINDSKMCFIKSKKWQSLEEHLTLKLKIGVTEMGNMGGIFRKKEPILLVIVPFHAYYDLKKEILKQDDKAFISSLDCYTVLGGYKRGLLPF